MRITSSANTRVKYVRRLQNERRFRHREGAFIAEGVRWLRDVVALGVNPRELFISDSAESRATTDLLEQLDCPQFTVPASIMSEMSDVESPSGVLLVLDMPPTTLPETPSLVLILDRIQTPGNMGSMLRTAAAAGADAVLIAPGSVDLYNPKVVRGAMGAHLHIANAILNWEEITEYIDGMGCWVASAETDTIYSDVDWRMRSALIIGNEANGPGEEARTLGSGASIPMAADTESLNAATAAAVMLFEAARQRGYGASRSA